MKNVNVNVILAACVGGVIGFAVATAIFKAPSTGQPTQAAVKAFADAARDAVRGGQPAAGGPDQVFKVLLGGSVQKGREDAKVTIVEWSDFQCPFCGRGATTMKEVEKLYGDDVRFVFKHNPLPMHPDAPFASKAAMAAGRQGKFWQMHDKLFEANLRNAQSEMGKAKVEQMARDLGLDMDRFGKDAASPELDDEIRSDQAQARGLGANGTPHFFVNGVRVSGAQPIDNFKAIIDRQIKKADEVLARGVSRKGLYDELIKDGATAPPAQPNRPTPPPQPAQVRKIEPGNGPAKGGKQPKVTIVQWSDFQCPFCTRAEPTVNQIIETYKDDVRVVWRNEPLSFHPNAMPAAKAAMAAHKQGKFWEMHAKLFAGQQQLSEENYEKWAKELGLNLAKWKADKESPEIADQINKDSSYGQSVGADGTPTFFINGKVIAGAMPFESFKPIIDEQIKLADELIKKGTPRAKIYDAIVAENVKAAPAAPAAQAAQAGDSGEKVKIDIGGSPVLGQKNAPVTIAIWSDFQCPYCSRVEPTFKQIRDEYGSKVKFVWKNQPLSFHPNAMPAAEAAHAAGEQGKFWEMHDKLFERQAQLGPQIYEQIAQELGLDLGKFKSAIESHKFAAQIQADMAAGNAVGAQGTPTMFINGRKLVGAQPFPAFKSIIDAELASAVAKK